MNTNGRPMLRWLTSRLDIGVDPTVILSYPPLCQTSVAVGQQHEAVA
ncbi:MAG: hypothetical protein QOG19_701 [Mycobacterium sp.]|nr:hypothetical protein [Mycobacterium sp.]